MNKPKGARKISTSIKYPADPSFARSQNHVIAYLLELSLSSGKAVVPDDAGDGPVGSEASSEKSDAHVTGLLQPGGVGLAEAGATLVLDLLDLLHLKRCVRRWGRLTGGGLKDEKRKGEKLTSIYSQNTIQHLYHHIGPTSTYAIAKTTHSLRYPTQQEHQRGFNRSNPLVVYVAPRRIQYEGTTDTEKRGGDVLAEPKRWNLPDRGSWSNSR